MKAVDAERVRWITAALTAAGLDALVCTVPENVRMLTGYWPVVGTAVAVGTRAGECAILAPEDEREPAEEGWAQRLRTYAPGSLERITGPAETVCGPLAALLEELAVAEGELGFEDGPVYAGASYAAMYFSGAGTQSVLTQAAPRTRLRSGAAAISRLRSALTPTEVDHLRLACRIVGEGFTAVPGELAPAQREPEVAARLAGRLLTHGLERGAVHRVQAFAWCMSGPNSALAGAAYARTRDRALRPGDLVLVHCNSSADGLWTDITRTYCLGEPDRRQEAMYEAILAARTAALAAIRPGVAASAVDRAGRAVLEERGFGAAFTHPIGHNVGFSAISAEFPPRLHPASTDRLEVGMTFNVEPAIYLEGFGGIRHCDVVTLHADGPEVLTPFQAEVESVIVPI